MLSNLKWLSIKQRIMFLTAVLVFKIMHSKTPNFISHWLVLVSHKYGTRRSTSADLFVPRSHPNMLTTKGTRLWNQFPTSIRTLPNLKTFKKATAFFIAHNFNIYEPTIFISHMHKHLHNISAWLHIYHPTI